MVLDVGGWDPRTVLLFLRVPLLKAWVPTAKKPGTLWGPLSSSSGHLLWFEEVSTPEAELKSSCCSNTPGSCCNWFPTYKENGINPELWSAPSSSWSCSKTVVSEVCVCMRVKPFLRYFSTKTLNCKLDYKKEEDREENKKRRRRRGAKRRRKGEERWEETVCLLLQSWMDSKAGAWNPAYLTQHWSHPLVPWGPEGPELQFSLKPPL